MDAAFVMNQPVTAICGPSGSGKTSILSIIAGLRRPDRGKVQLGKRLLEDRVAGFHLAPEARRIGYVFQQIGLFPHMTVEHNIGMGYVPSELAHPGGTLVIDCRGKMTDAEIVSGPFYKRARE